MKILLMTSLWGRHGGKEQYLQLCIDEFTRMGHDCCLAYGRMSPQPGPTSLLPIRQYEITAYSDIASNEEVLGAEQLTRVLRNETPDVIFMCDVRNLRLLTVLKNYDRLVTMSHDNWLTCMRGTATTYLRRAICTNTFGCRCLFHGCFLRKHPAQGGLTYNSFTRHRAVVESYKAIGTHLVATTYMKQRLVQHGFDPDCVHVIGYFTDLKPAETPGAGEAVPTVTFVGRIDRYKGVDYLMRALAKVSAPLKCTVIGDGDYLPYCKQLSRALGIADRVAFTGWLSRHEVTEHLAKSYLIVVPSIWPEPFGLIGLEAMTCSKPVVAFDTGGIRDWLKDGVNGYLVPAKSADLLAQRIDVLLRDPKQAGEMGAAGLRILNTSFGKAQHFRNLFSAFESAIGDGRTGGTDQSLLPASEIRDDKFAGARLK